MVALAMSASARGDFPERVVYCRARVGACTSLTALGTAAGGFWARANDAELVSGGRPMPAVLYFSPEAYEQALAGLVGKQREEAIAHRLEQVSDHPETALLARLQSDLLGLARASGERDSEDFDLLVAAAAVLRGGEERLEGATPVEILSMGREHLAQLMVELPRGPLGKAYGREATALARLTVEVRKDPTQAVLPFAESEPVYFVPSVPDKTVKVLAQLGQYPHPWRGGVVTILSPRKLSQAPWKGQSIRLLYPGKGPYLRDLLDLTPAQMDRRLHSVWKGGAKQARAEFVAGLAFEHAALLHSMVRPLAKAHVPWLARLQDIVALDTDNLRRTLAATGPEAGKERKRRLQDSRADFELAAAILRGTDRGKSRAARLARATELLAHLPR